MDRLRKKSELFTLYPGLSWNAHDTFVCFWVNHRIWTRQGITELTRSLQLLELSLWVFQDSFEFLLFWISAGINCKLLLESLDLFWNGWRCWSSRKRESLQSKFCFFRFHWHSESRIYTQFMQQRPCTSTHVLLGTLCLSLTIRYRCFFCSCSTSLWFLGGCSCECTSK